MAIWNAHPYDMMISLAMFGIGLGVAFTALSTVVVHAVPPTKVGETTGMNTVIRMLGGAVGTQVVSSLISGDQRGGRPVLAGFTQSWTAEVAFFGVAALAATIISACRAGARQ